MSSESDEAAVEAAIERGIALARRTGGCTLKVTDGSRVVILTRATCLRLIEGMDEKESDVGIVLVQPESAFPDRSNMC